MSEFDDVWETLDELLIFAESESTTTTEAQREVPVGTVARLRQGFEERIVQHAYERDAVYINRARRQLDILHQQNRTYAAALRSVESHTLLGLPLYLVDFLRDHDNLHRAALRSRARAERASDPRVELDVFIRISDRLRSIHMVYILNMLCETLAPEERVRMQQDPGFKREFHELSKLLADELVRMLTHLEILIPLVLSDAELENIGPDHDVDDFGRNVANRSVFDNVDEVDANDHSVRCCICFDAYDTDTHPDFQVEKCGHITGKPCLATWLNSTSKNSNLCPHCRTELCERRNRRPKPADPAIAAEKERELQRLARAKELMQDIDNVYTNIIGEEGERIMVTIVEAANVMLAQNDVGFGFVAEPSPGPGWRSLRRVYWGG